jgi:hypothetical protein
MTDFAAAAPTGGRVELSATDVLSRAWTLYKRLFLRSIVMAGVVFGAVNLLQVLIRADAAGRSLGLLVVALSFAGTALLEGGLVEIVQGLHVDGDDDATLPEAFGRAGGEFGKLLAVSLLSAFGMALGFLLFVVPGFILMTRWAVAVPVAMLEQGNARDAMKRSSDMVAGNGWCIFRVLLGVGVLTGIVTIPFALVSAHAGVFGWWVALTLSSMLTAPYAAHAITVAYFLLRDPHRPVILDPGHRWQSVWEEQAAGAVEPASPAAESIDAEYQRRFDEYQQRWGGGGS